MQEVHDFVAGAIRAAQRAGGVLAERDAEAEAWIVVAGGLLISVGDRLGGPPADADLGRIARARHAWLTGGKPLPAAGA
jgi:hypothetical protein